MNEHMLIKTLKKKGSEIKP